MLKDYYNEIIPPWDSRYGKIGHIRKLYKDSNHITKLGNNSYKYYIPYQLVINDYVSYRVNITNSNSSPNLVGSGKFKELILFTTGLTDELFYILLIIKSNNKFDYLRCANCHNRLTFTNYLRGYCSGGRLPEDYLGKITCSQSCLMYYKYKSNNIYGDIGFSNWKINARTKMNWFINNVTSDISYFYISIVGGKFKYGITSDPDQRDYRYHTYGLMDQNDNLRTILSGPTVKIAQLEYQIKLNLNTDSESLEFTGLMYQFRKAFIDAYRLIFDQILI